MQYINFEEISSYFKNEIDMIVYNLQDANLIAKNEDDGHGNIKQPFKFVFFINDGDYHKAVKEPNALKDKDWPEIPILIKNAGGVQDNNTALDIYLQKVEFEIYGWCDRTDEYKNQWDDVEMIFSYFCASMKNKISEIGGNTVKLDASDYPVLNELDNRHFVGFLNINLIIMFTARLSNKDSIKINGEEIPYTNFNEILTVEMLSDNKMTSMVKFLPNVSVYQLNLNGLYVSGNDIVRTLVEGCSTGRTYAMPFNIEIIRDGIVISSRTMYLKESQVIRSFGSIIGYTASFFPSYIGG